ncbi:MAG TPA: VOC family protein [Hypericibacter adhaerens]|jgi:PhnB protein|uniref:Glyoxalase n=1 Tax=Hypericibacter adhaerens TaxID=2602016 RepID=A0A5J6N7N3_9PROT|nr:VOC family protein [Hypericibacter adhaerens]QEX24840.1 glyoxalase [Hypericibacter adhaerens]HWA42769.1 VOC family protein [Hypericibacter adhaerens]
MAGKPKPVPEGHHSVTPYLMVAGAAQAIAFYEKAFGAKEALRLPMPDGRIGHAEITVGDSRIMLADEYPEMNAKAPPAYGGSPVHLHLYVPDVDAVAKSALAAGAKEVRPVQNQFYGDRSGSFQDPFGHVWHIATHVEDVPLEEIAKRAAAAMAKKALN